MGVLLKAKRLYEFGSYSLDAVERVLLRDGQPVILPPKDLETLLVMVERAGHIVEKEELLETVWPGVFIEEGNLARHIFNLRQVLGDSPDGRKYIETIPKRGYRFVAAVHEDQEPAAAHPAAPQTSEQAPTVVPLGQKRSLWLWLLALSVALGVALGATGLREKLFRKSDATTIRSLAVLPLENLSHDPEQEYFADGMTEALTTELAQIGTLKVISRTSVMQYKRTKKLLPQIAKELGVDAVVEGAVQRSGDKVGITVQLIHAPTDRHLLAKSYERSLRDVLALQREIAHAIADEIKVKLTPQEQARLTTARSVNSEAHEAYLRGLYYYSAGHDEADPHKYDQLLKSSIEYFSQATQMDPNYAPAYAGMGIAYVWQSGSDRKGNLKAREAADKALQIDDSVGEAHYVLGWVAYFYDWNWPGAEKEFRRAIELNPSFGEAHYGYALYLNSAGRHDEAIAEIQRAQEVDPIVFTQKVDAGRIYACAGQYDRAIKQLRDAPDLKPNDYRVHDLLGDIYLYKGMQAESAAEYRKAAQLNGRRLELAAADAVSGNRTEASAILSDLANLPYQWVDWPVDLARRYASLGEKNLAMAWLEKAYNEHSYALLDIRCMREFDVLQSDPRFQDLLRRMNFTQ
ncbi:MAG: hypothetical protein AUH11_17910 [Acidobacteria bacterium 13_2_20CM_57_17]|nr:MAG: hypothetical protein AUH11_17910 [Acidobacteria bacterium 13_2_20CM_57_17]